MCACGTNVACLYVHINSLFRHQLSSFDVFPSVTQCYSVLLGVTRCYSVLLSVGGNYYIPLSTLNGLFLLLAVVKDGAV